jgi:PhnB protein
MQVQTYLFFEGRCEEAIEFYKKAVGAEVTMIMRMKESPEQGEAQRVPPEKGDKILHSAFKVGETTVLASDGECSGKVTHGGFALSLTLTQEAEAKKYFDALSQGGKVNLPLTKTFFSPSFGMLVDRFGVMWMVYVTQ